MSPLFPDHLRLLKLLNRSSVLTMIRKEGPLSRAELAERIGLSRPSISAIVEELLAANLVREIGRGPSSGGRRPIMLEFNAQAYYIIGAVFEGLTLSAAITDLNGQVVCRAQTQLTKTQGEDAAVKVAGFLHELCQTQNLQPVQLLGIGIGVPGVTDPRSGTVSAAPSVGWIKHFPLRPVLEESFHLPVLIENDVNVVALGEMWRGAGQGVENMAVMHVGTGIGAGLVTGGRLFRGVSGAAGEIGHLPVGTGSRQPKDFGIYERNWSSPAVLARLAELCGRLSSEDAVRPLAALCRLAAESEAANALFREACRHYAYGVASLACVFNPTLVVLAGQLVDIGPQGLALVRNWVDQWVPFPPTITFAALKDLAGNIGAALAVLHSEEETMIQNTLC